MHLDFLTFTRFLVPVASSAIFGRITGSDSVDTLVRVGLEKQHGLPANAKMVVLQDFSPGAEKELEVKRGQEVFQLYKENDWCYVITVDGREGFIPESFCLGVTNSPSVKSKSKDSPRNSGEYRSFDTFDSDSFFSCNEDYVNDVTDKSPVPLNQLNVVDYQNIAAIPEVRPFRKTSHGHFIVLFDFTAQDENDVTVERAELLDVLNIEDPDWSWVRRGNGEEGFVPKSYICPVEPLKAQEKMLALQHKQKRSSTPTIRQPLLSNFSPRRYSQSSEPPTPPQRNPLRTSALRTRYNELDQESNYSDTQKEQHRSNSASRQNGEKYSVVRSPLVTSIGAKRSNSPSRVSQNLETIRHGDDSLNNPPLIVYDKPYSQRVASRSPSPRLPPSFSELSNQSARQRTRSASPASSRASVSYENVNIKSTSDNIVNVSNVKKTSLSLSDQNLYKKQSNGVTKKYSSYQNLSSGNFSLVQNGSSGLYTNTATNQSNASSQNDTGPEGLFVPNSRLSPNESRPDCTRQGSELIMMYDFNDENRGGLLVSRGDLVYADGMDQQGTDWLWVYYPQTSQYGYVPRNYVKSTQLKTTL